MTAKSTTWKKIITCGFIFLVCIAGSIHSRASQSTATDQQIFPNEQVAALQEQASHLPVEADKTENRQFSFASTTKNSSYPTRSGVILVTNDKYKGLIPTGHAAIIYSYNTVIESLSCGVVAGPNNWNYSKQTCYGVTATGTSVTQDKNAAEWCYKQIGKPYNYNFINIWTRDRFYCSQLVWAAFYDNFRINLSTNALNIPIHPIELVISPHTNVIYKK